MGLHLMSMRLIGMHLVGVDLRGGVSHRRASPTRRIVDNFTNDLCEKLPLYPAREFAPASANNMSHTVATTCFKTPLTV
jgi:hypothetical protein